MGPDDLLANQGSTALSACINAAKSADPLVRAREVAAMPSDVRGDAMAALLEDLPWVAAAHVAPAGTKDLIATELKKGSISKRTFTDRLKAFSQSLAGPRETGAVRERYRVVDGKMCEVSMGKGGEVVEPLANFTAEITEEVDLDDGAERQKLFKVQIELEGGRRPPPLAMIDEDFLRMNWPLRMGGTAAAVAAGQGVKDKLREAIQLHSRPGRRTVRAHLGWIEEDGEFVYLHAGGSIPSTSNEVQVPDGLNAYQLPEQIVDRTDAVRRSISFLRIGAPSITMPIWAVIHLAPLASIVPISFLLWLFSRTGSLKSSVLALAMCHYGKFTHLNLPGNWEGTDNSLEGRMFSAKDSVFAIDDFVPQKSLLSRKELDRKAQRVVESIGNRQSRSRLRADLTQRPDRPPRGVVVSTGEDLVSGLSLLARCFVVDFELAQLNIPAVTELQAHSDRLAHAGRSYIEYLRPQMPTLRATVAETLRERREQARATAGTHLRMPEAVAQLYLGLDLGLAHATDVGAVTQAEADELRETGWNVFMAGASSHAGRLQTEDPATIWLETVVTLLEQGRVHFVEGRDSPLDTVGHRESMPIGWMDDEFVYVVPRAAREQVLKAMPAESTPIPSDAALGKALKARGLLVTDEGDDHLQRLVRLGGGGQRKRVYQNPPRRSGPGRRRCPAAPVHHRHQRHQRHR